MICPDIFLYADVLSILLLKHDLTVIPSPYDKLDSSILKDFADDNSKFDENGRKFSKRVKKHGGKRRNCSLTLSETTN